MKFDPIADIDPRVSWEKVGVVFSFVSIIVSHSAFAGGKYTLTCSLQEDQVKKFEIAGEANQSSTVSVAFAGMQTCFPELDIISEMSLRKQKDRPALDFKVGNVEGTYLPKSPQIKESYSGFIMNADKTYVSFELSESGAGPRKIDYLGTGKVDQTLATLIEGCKEWLFKVSKEDLNILSQEQLLDHLRASFDMESEPSSSENTDEDFNSHWFDGLDVYDAEDQPLNVKRQCILPRFNVEDQTRKLLVTIRPVLVHIGTKYQGKKANTEVFSPR